jgi:hypothetical protein
MMTVATIVKHSDIHGLGCFAAEDILPGAVVWVFSPEVDHMRLFQTSWEWQHSYKSHVQSNLWILSRDNAAWINFADRHMPNLVEGGIINGEPCLIAARHINAGEELTVGPETDADSEEKLKYRE